MKPKYLSEVTVKVSETEDGKFKGHVFADGEHTVTVPNKSRETAIGHAMSEAKSLLRTDNIAPDKSIETEHSQVQPGTIPQPRPEPSRSKR